MSLAGVVSGAAASAHVVKDDREAWLQSAWAGLVALYASHGVALPDARLSVGVPPTAARARKRATAESVPVAIWGDKKRGYEIHVNPKHLDTALRAVSALMHGAYVMTGKLHAAGAPALVASLPVPPTTIADSQHEDASGAAGTSKQTTRLLKAKCRACAFVCRVAKKQADRGLPICGVCYPIVNRLELV